jgi:hypothetical protein
MGKMTAPARAEMACIRAVVTRADGTVEDHGVVSYYHRNPLRRAYYRLTGKVL